MAREKDEQPTLQDCFESIEAVIEDLEDGDLPLEDAFARYEAGLRSLQS
ncbi:MAG: exodeoxyribonuclease VII small subunit, partial [Planctomycetota bacterium]